MRPREHLLRWAWLGAVGVLAVALQWAGELPSALSQPELLIRDALRRATASAAPEPRVVVVDIDEASIEAAGPWPWPRTRIAELSERLLADGRARAVGLDIVFPSPADKAGDERLAALARIAPVVLAQAMDFAQRDEPLRTGVPVFGAPPVTWAGVTAARVQGYVANHAGLADAPCVGNIGILPDVDGRVRRVPLLSEDGSSRRTALLPLAMLACANGRPVDVERLGKSLMAASVDTARWEVPFAREWAAYDVISARALLAGAVPADRLQGRWVLIGSSALGLNDRAATPLSSSAAGVMVHAAALSGLLDHLEGRVFPLPIPAAWVASLWSVLVVGALGWALGRFKAWWLIPAVLASAAVWLGLATWMLRHATGFVVAGPLFASLLVLALVSLELWRVQHEQSQLLRSFSAYVAPAVVQEMLRQGIANPMKPQHRQISVLSADMQNYSGLTAQAGLHDAADLTRDFLHWLTQPIFLHGGTLDKYTGDGLVAFWGAPLPQKDHAQQALQAAREIIGLVREWNLERVAQGKSPARVRIGIESGEALVGDLGTSYRSTYTAVGDCINHASKLQAMAKTLQCDVVVGPNAAQAVGHAGLQPVAQSQLPGLNENSTLWSFPDLRSCLP